MKSTKVINQLLVSYYQFFAQQLIIKKKSNEKRSEILVCNTALPMKVISGPQ